MIAIEGRVRWRGHVRRGPLPGGSVLEPEAVEHSVKEWDAYDGLVYAFLPLEAVETLPLLVQEGYKAFNTPAAPTTDGHSKGLQ